MRTIKVNGARLAFIDEGEGAPVLLLHGLGGSADDWRLQRAEFAARYRVIIPDLRGFGASERREPFTIPQHARDMAALLEALGIRRAHVIGLSMGGAIAIELAYRAPGQVAALVLANTAPGFLLTNWQRRRMAFKRVLVAAFFGVGAVARLFSQKLFPARHQGRLRRRQIQRASQTSRWVYLASLRALTRWNGEKRLGAVAAPTLGDRCRIRLHAHGRKTPLGGPDPGSAVRRDLRQPPSQRAGFPGALQPGSPLVPGRAGPRLSCDSAWREETGSTHPARRSHHVQVHTDCCGAGAAAGGRRHSPT